MHTQTHLCIHTYYELSNSREHEETSFIDVCYVPTNANKFMLQN